MDLRREDFVALMDCALEAVQGRRVVCAALRTQNWREPVHVLALGKAAAAMAQGAAEMLGAQWARGLVVTRHDYLPEVAHRLAATTYVSAGHPLPDQQSLQAGDAVVRFIAETPHDARLLVLISGGTSALVEKLPAGVTLSDWQRVNGWLLGSGLDIYSMNAVRKGLSCLKAGRLAAMIHAHATDVLLMSDVPGDDPRVIGSGLLVPDDTVVQTLHQLALPDWITALLRSAPHFPASGDSCFNNISTRVVARNADARAALVLTAQQQGIAVTNYSDEFTGTVTQAAAVIGATLRSGAKGLHVWGGEPTMMLPAAPGRGGRNLHLALTVAQSIAGRHDLMFCAFGTDGSDGNTTDAGALVDGLSLSRGQHAGLDPAACLAQADAASFLEVAGDVLTTGPTGTNVMDLMIGWAAPPEITDSSNPVTNHQPV